MKVLLENGKQAYLIHSYEGVHLVKHCDLHRSEPFLYYGEVYDTPELEKLQKQKRSLEEDIAKLNSLIEEKEKIADCVTKMSQENLEIAISALLKMSRDKFHHLYDITHPSLVRLASFKVDLTDNSIILEFYRDGDKECQATAWRETYCVEAEDVFDTDKILKGLMNVKIWRASKETALLTSLVEKVKENYINTKE